MWCVLKIYIQWMFLKLKNENPMQPTNTTNESIAISFTVCFKAAPMYWLTRYHCLKHQQTYLKLLTLFQSLVLLFFRLYNYPLRWSQSTQMLGLYVYFRIVFSVLVKNSQLIKVRSCIVLDYLLGWQLSHCGSWQYRLMTKSAIT